MCHTPTRNKQGESHHYCTATEYIFKPEMSTGSQQTALHTCLPIHGVKQPTIHWLHPLPQRSCEHRCSLWRPFKTRKPGFQWKKRCYVWRFLPLESKIIFKSRSNCIYCASLRFDQQLVHTLTTEPTGNESCGCLWRQQEAGTRSQVSCCYLPYPQTVGTNIMSSHCLPLTQQEALPCQI